MAETVAVLSLAATAAGGVVAFQQSRVQKAVAEQNADAARRAGQAEEVRLRRDRARRLGATRAQFGASGFTFDGSPLDVLADEAMTAEEDAQLLKFRTGLEVRRHNIAADAFQQQGYASLLGSLGSAAGQAVNYQSAGVFGEDFLA